MDVDPVSAGGEPTARRQRLYVTLAVVALLIMAAGLRLYRLGMPDLWGDEILYLRMCHPGLSVTETILEHTRSYKYVGHLPSTAVLTNLGLKAMGAKGTHDITSFNSRVPSVAMGLLTVVLLGWWVFRMSRNRWAGLCCLAVGGLSFLHLWYSREAYHYPGEVLYAVMAGFLTFELASVRGSVQRRLALLAGVAVSGLLVTFSHPTGALMPAVLAIYALGVALIWERRNWHLYVAVLVLAGLAAAPILMAGTGQDRASTGQRPWSFAPAETWHLLQFMTLGPGWWRGIMGLGLLVFGGCVALRSGSRHEKWLLILAPLLLLAIHAGRNYPYRPRYSLLLWPFVVHLLARGCGALCEAVSEKRRYVALAGVVVLLAAVSSVGYRELYGIRAKRDAYTTLANEIDARLPRGTICVWNEGHAMRFLPGFHTTKKSMLFSSMADASVAAFEQGRVQQSLRVLASSFPCVALLDYGSSTDKTSASLQRQGKTFRDEVLGVLPEHVEMADSGFASLVNGGWYPNAVPCTTRSMAETRELTIASSSVQLFGRTKGIPDPVMPVFAPGQWRLVFLQNGAPMLIGPYRREIAFEPLPGRQSGPVTVRIAAVGIVPGQLEMRLKDAVVGRMTFGQAGQAQATELRLPRVTGSVVTLEYRPSSTWGEVREPFFGVLSVRTTPSTSK